MKFPKKQILVSMIPFLTLMPMAGWADVALPEGHSGFMDMINQIKDDASEASLKSFGIDKKTFKFCKNNKADEKKSALEHFIEGLSIDLNLKERFKITDGVKINGGYRITAEPSIGGKYARVDSWEAGGSLSSRFLDGIFKHINIGVGVERKTSFTRLFDSQRESICQLPYNPIEHTPTTVDAFKNLKAGDLLSFSAPLSLTLGGVLPSNLINVIGASVSGGYLGFGGEIAYTVTGDFDVNILVIDKDHIRVRILVSKDKTVGLSAGLRITGLSSFEKIAASVLINPKILTGIIQSSTADLSVADYIFNINDPTAKDLYNKIIGPKLKFANVELTKEKILALIEPTTQTDRNHDARLRDLFNDAIKLNKIAEEDKDKSIQDRRITKLLNLNNETNSSSVALKLNVTPAIKISGSKKRTENSLFTIYSDLFESGGGSNVKIKMDSIISSKSFKFIHLKTTHNVVNSILANVTKRDTKLLGERPGVPLQDSEYDATQFQGYQYSSIFKKRKISKDDVEKIKLHLKSSLPSAVANKLEFDNWKIDDGLHNFYLQQDITFTSQLFNLKAKITKDDIRNALRNIIAEGKDQNRIFHAKPIGIVGSHSVNSKIIEENFTRERFALAYGFGKLGDFEGEPECSFECAAIPERLAFVLNSENKNIADRYFQLESLLRYYPLFVEVAPELLFRIIPEQELASVLDLYIIASAKGKTSISLKAESSETASAQLIRQLLSFMSYLDSKGSDNPNDNRVLRQFYNDDGVPFTPAELDQLKRQLHKTLEKK